MVTLKDVAKAVGLSPKTVSRVVNDDPAVQAATRELVQDAIRRLNYVPDYAARMMRTTTSSVVGLMTDVVATTPYSVDIVRGTQSALRERAQTMLIGNTEGDAATEREYWNVFQAHKVAGVIYATVHHRPVDLTGTDFERPLVLANCYSPRRDRPSIVPDDEGGGYTQARYLIERGHRRIGIVSLNPAIRATALRGAGHRAAFAEGGLSFDPAFEVPGFVGPVMSEALVAYDAALRLLSATDRPTAMICGNDRVAMQVYAAAATLGLAVPDDLSIIGFDDMSIITETLHPRLTSVALPYFDIGRIAVETLAAIARNTENAATPLSQLVPCPLVERQSCRAIG
jgi:LacI family transcriptional regulator